MKKWLVDNYDKYDNDWVALSKDFNAKFGTDYSNCRLAKYCERNLKIHKPKEKKGIVNKGTFTVGNRRGGQKELPIGTIRYNTDGRPFIKVMESDGRSGKLRDTGKTGHNFQEPYWKPLQKKIWEDHYGEVPKGYVVCSLNGDCNDTDIRHIGIVDKRGTARMAKLGWWSDNKILTENAVQWCNLYYTAKDNGIIVNDV